MFELSISETVDGEYYFEHPTKTEKMGLLFEDAAFRFSKIPYIYLKLYKGNLRINVFILKIIIFNKGNLTYLFKV